MKKTKILVVEDAKLDRDLLMAVLSKFNFEITIVETGFDAKKEFNGDYDAVIMDLGLPDISGLHMIRWFRSRRPDVPICIVTGDTDPLVKSQIFEAGSVMLIHKNYSAADNMGLLSLLEMRHAAYQRGRRTQNRYTTIFGVATIALGVASGAFHLLGAGVGPDWALITALVTAGIGLIRAADADKKEK